jgi:adenylate cyclase
MLSSLLLPPNDGQAPPRAGPWLRLARRHPFAVLFLLVILSNVAGSIFNFAYNNYLIVEGLLNERQREVFWTVASPIYNVIAYPTCVALMVCWLWPLIGCRRKLLAGEPIAPSRLEHCRRRLINGPFYTMALNFFGWIPGAVFFPLVICAVGGTQSAMLIWWQFAVSFVVSALLTTAQTFFIIETYLMAVFYPDFFRDARPADVQGVFRISFGQRMLLLWAAVGLMPLLGLLMVALNLPGEGREGLNTVAIGVAVVGAASGGLIFWFVGRDLRHWLVGYASATERITRERFDTRIVEKRPDEFGRLTDRFNDMAAALQRGQQEHETFGQFVGPEVRDQILERYPGLGGEVQEITVLFVDIRGFTRRSSGQDPARVVELLNRFLTLVVRAVEGHGGYHDKFLGDGAMALFGATRLCDDHADQAVAAARDIVVELDHLNAELGRQGQAPLAIGIGIHTGPALVGCIGAALSRDGRPHFRKGFTAIGETVNVCQRIEQLTKTCGGPVLISAQTRARLHRPVTLEPLGIQPLPGSADFLIFRVNAASSTPPS